MKKKELKKLMMGLSGELAFISPASTAVRGGETVSVHRYALGAAMALGLVALAMNDKASEIDEKMLEEAIITAALEWEEENGFAHEPAVKEESHE